MKYICLRSCVLFYDANTVLNISKNKYVPADPEFGLVLGFRFERIRCRRCFTVPFSCIAFKVCGLVDLYIYIKYIYKCIYIYLVDLEDVLSRGGGLGSRPIFKKFHETYAPS